MSAIELEGVTKTYRGGIAGVRDLNLRAEDGALTVVVGPSGCGKTTTLRLIAGLERPTAGTIRFGERVVNRVTPRDRDVAMVFQEDSLYSHMTIRENLGFASRLRKVPKPEIARRIDETARLLGIESLLDRKPATLSGGERQRAAVGRAIVRRPRCTLLDEPLSNLDASLRLRLRAEFKALHQRLRMTTVYVTHDQEEALTLGERLVVMAGGRVQQVGPPLAVFRAPANRFVAGFIGAPPMNFIDGRLRAEGGMVSFTDGREIEIALGAGAADRWRGLAQWSGRPVVLGVRPEHLRLGDAAAGASEVPLIVAVVEPLGTRTDLVGTTAAGASITARLDGCLDLAPGDRPVLRVRPDDLHLFEPEPDGRRIDPRP